MNAIATRKPSVIIIGTLPSAASWVRRALAARPDVHQPAKPTSFAALNSGDLGAYLQPFEDWQGEPVSVDVVDVLRYRARPAELAPRLTELLPDTRLVAVLSAPWERAGQAFAAHQAAGRIDQDVTFGQRLHSVDHRLDPLEIMSAGNYEELLAPFVASPLPLLVVAEEELVTDPDRTWLELLDFIGLRWKRGDTPAALRRAELESRPWRQPDPRLSDDDRWFCRRFYEGTTDALDALVGRPITQRW